MNAQTDEDLSPLEQSGQPPAPAPVRIRPVTLTTYSLLGLIITVWLAGRLGGPDVSGWLEQHFAESAGEIWDGQYWRLVTYGLLHANLPHLLFNAYGLYVIGSLIELIYRPGRFLAGFFLAVLGGSVLGVLTAPSRDLFQAVGASGGLFGLVGMHMALVLNYRKVLHPQFLRASWTNLILVIGINGAYGLLNSQIDNAGHLGGFLAGLGWGLVITVPNFPAHIHPSRLWLKKIVFATTLAAAISYAILPKTDSVPYLHFTGHQALERDDTASAIASFERLLTLQPDHVETQYNLAVIYARQGDYPAAAKHANAALQLLPDNSQIKRLNEALAPLLTEP